jgi:hypothetical protein
MPVKSHFFQCAKSFMNTGSDPVEGKFFQCAKLFMKTSSGASFSMRQIVDEYRLR